VDGRQEGARSFVRHVTGAAATGARLLPSQTQEDRGMPQSLLRL
jgi:hypothetical protein